MKKDDFLTKLVAHYWTARDFRQLQKEYGMEAFEDINWQKEAALQFVTKNLAECERIFNHRHITKCK